MLAGCLSVCLTPMKPWGCTQDTDDLSNIHAFSEAKCNLPNWGKMAFNEEGYLSPEKRLPQITPWIRN